MNFLLSGKKPAAQGDLLVRPVSGIPEGFVPVQQDNPLGYVVAHSETGHHHVATTTAAKATLYRMPPAGATGPVDPSRFGGGLLSYLEIQEGVVELLHQRPHDTHQTLQLPAGIWELRRQFDHGPEGWKVVQD